MAASICSQNFTVEIIVSLDCTFTITSTDTPQIPAIIQQGNTSADGGGSFRIEFSYIVGLGSTADAVFHFDASAAPTGVTVSHVFVRAAPDRANPTIAKTAYVDVTVAIDSTGASPAFTDTSDTSFELVVGMDTNGAGAAPDFV